MDASGKTHTERPTHTRQRSLSPTHTCARAHTLTPTHSATHTAADAANNVAV